MSNTEDKPAGDAGPIDETDAKIAEFLAKSKRRKLGTSRRLHQEPVTEISEQVVPAKAPLKNPVNFGGLSANPSDALDVKKYPKQTLEQTTDRFEKKAQNEGQNLEVEKEAKLTPVQKQSHEETDEGLQADTHFAPRSPAETSKYDYTQTHTLNISPKKKPNRLTFWGFLKASYRTLGVIVFLAAATLVTINFSKPWLQAWLKDERPAITLPSVSNLRAMPQDERMRLKNAAVRLAPFKRKQLVSDPIPFEGGRPTELDQFRLRAVGDGVKIAGLLRLYEMPDKRQFLRLTDFEITAGYDLRVLLSVDSNPSSKADLDSQGYVDLAALKGDIGPQNYLLPKTFELSDFGSFVIYDQLFEIVYAISRL